MICKKLQYLNSGKYHEASGKSLCYPYIEGGASFRSITDCSNVLTPKKMVEYENIQLTLELFMLDKYYHNSHPLNTSWKKEDSQIWKAICGIKNEVESHIVICSFKNLTNQETL